MSSSPAVVRVEVRDVDPPTRATVTLVHGVDVATGDHVDVAAEPRLARDLADAIAADGPQVVTVEAWQVVDRRPAPRRMH